MIIAHCKHQDNEKPYKTCVPSHCFVSSAKMTKSEGEMEERSSGTLSRISQLTSREGNGFRFGRGTVVPAMVANGTG